MIIQRNCLYCNEIFNADGKQIKYETRVRKRLNPRAFCSTTCRSKYQNIGKSFQINCTQCGKEFIRIINQFNRSENHFCCQSCATTFNNRNKTKGIRRSKLEQYIEEKIKLNFPELEIITNSLELLKYELDFYFPSKNLAIEINGIFHFKPIYGQEKLDKIIKNDQEKIRLCSENNIQLYVYEDLSTRFYY